MNVLLISQCTKNALTETRRILDQFAERRGDRTWQTPITRAGLETLHRLLRKTARKNTAVACHWIRSKDHSELLWIVGDARQFSDRGATPTNTTRRNVLRTESENDWHSLALIHLLASLAALLHDLGKACMPLDILNKPGQLTDDEYMVMRTHPEEGERLLRHSGLENAAVLHMVRHHHEKYDGGGYPARLPADAIPLLTRMSAVCDVYDAITSNRPYKEGWDPGESLRRMASWKGHFDPAVLKAFIASVGIYPIGTLVRLSSERLAVVLEQGPGALSAPRVRVFFSARLRRQVLQQDLDLWAPGCGERITGIESPRQWGFRELEKLWAP